MCSLEQLANIFTAPPPSLFECSLSAVMFIRGGRFYAMCCHVCVCCCPWEFTPHTPALSTFGLFVVFACEGRGAADAIHRYIIYTIIFCVSLANGRFRCLATLRFTHSSCCVFLWPVPGTQWFHHFFGNLFIAKPRGTHPRFIFTITNQRPHSPPPRSQGGATLPGQ